MGATMVPPCTRSARAVSAADSADDRSPLSRGASGGGANHDVTVAMAPLTSPLRLNDRPWSDGTRSVDAFSRAAAVRTASARLCSTRYCVG